MGIVALIVLAIAIAAMVVVFLVKRGKEDELETKPSVEPEKPTEKPKEKPKELVDEDEMEKQFNVGDVVVYTASHPAYSGLYLLGNPNDLHIGYSNANEPYNIVLRNCTKASADERSQFMLELESNGYKWNEDTLKIEEKEPEKEKDELEKEYDKYDYENAMNYFLAQFLDVVKVENGSCTWNYLLELLKEAKAQYNDKSEHHLPALYKEECFPNIYNFYGDEGDEEKTFKTFVGWLFAMQLAELRPQDRTAIYKIGYEMGGYNKDSMLYGWKFECDPNIARMVAAAIYAAMRGACNPDIEAMREEVEGENHYGTIAEAREYNSFEVGEEDFFVDLRKFMPTAPGPYAPGYQDRSQIGGYPFPNDAKMDDGNLAIDRAIRDWIVEQYNLNEGEPILRKRVVQAIADKDANYNHLFGRQRMVDNYVFNPVFTKDDLGQEVYPSLAKELCSLVDDVLHIGSYQRCILQGNASQMNPPQYGRLRPGCSWQVEAHRHSYDDDRQNVLVNFPIEENDGNPTGYYDKNGEWTNKDGIHSPEEYEDVMKDELWANSYPSGHSSAIWSCCLLLIELLPHMADKLLAAANRFAVNRTIARFHWNSDTIQGRVLATCIAPIIRCCSDWKERFKKAKECLK